MRKVISIHKINICVRELTWVSMIIVVSCKRMDSVYTHTPFVSKMKTLNNGQKRKEKERL